MRVLTEASRCPPLASKSHLPMGPKGRGELADFLHSQP